MNLVQFIGLCWCAGIPIEETINTINNGIMTGAMPPEWTVEKLVNHVYAGMDARLISHTMNNPLEFRSIP